MVPWQDRIESNRNGPGKTDLSAMGVATQEQTEIGMSGLAIDLRGVRQQDRELIVRDRGSGLFNIVNAVVSGHHLCRLDGCVGCRARWSRTR